MRYFLELSYLGTAYRGWQRQPNAPSVQAAVEDVLNRLLGTSRPTPVLHQDPGCGNGSPSGSGSPSPPVRCERSITVVGCGRTDTGVHASRYFAHFDVPTAPSVRREGSDGLNVTNFLHHANAMLPPDIAFLALLPVANDAHARFDALSREYTYRIATRKNPFSASTAWYYSVPLDVEAMNVAAAKLLTISDFTSFAKLGSDNRTNVCRVSHAEWVRASAENGGETQNSGAVFCAGSGSDHCVGGGVGFGSGLDGRWTHDVADELIFTIRADRFLRNMVRAIVGTLVDVGRGKISVDRFCEIVDSRDLSLSSGSAPAKGLTLSNITYA